MTPNDLKQIRTIIKEELSPIDTRLGKVETKIGSVETKLGNVEGKLETLWDQVIEVTTGLDDVKEAQQLHTAALKRIEVKTEHNSDNIHKLSKRLTTAERSFGISAPPEFIVIE